MQRKEKDFPDEITLRINNKGEIVIGNIAISRRLRKKFIDKYRSGDCRTLAFLSAYTDTGTSFRKKMEEIADLKGEWRNLPDRAHPDRACCREIVVGYGGKRYDYEKGARNSHAPRRSAPKHEHHGSSKSHGSRGHAQHHASSGHHGRYGKHGEYIWG